MVAYLPPTSAFFLALTALLLCLTTVTSAGQVTWTCTSGGWSDTSCWSPNPPGPDDDVIIQTTGTYTVSATTSISVGSITLGSSSTGSGAQTLTVAAGVTTSGAFNVEASGVFVMSVGDESLTFASSSILGTLNWVSGTISCANSASFVVGSGGTLSVTAEGSRNLDADLVVEGSLSWQSGLIQIQSNLNMTINGGILNIASGSNQAVLSASSADSALVIMNGGQLVLESGSPTIQVLTLVDGSSISTTAGSLVFQTPAVVVVTDSTVTVAAPSSMAISVDVQVTGGQFTGTGSVSVTGGSLTVSSPFTPASLSLTGAGVVTLSGTASSLNSLELTGGTLIVNGGLTVVAVPTWTVGTVTGVGAFTVTTNLALSGSGATIAMPVTINGAATIAPASVVSFSNSGSLNVATSGTLTVQGATAPSTTTLSATSSDVVLSVSGGFTVGGPALNNVRVTGGVEWLVGSQVNVESGGNLELQNGLTSAATVTIDGTVNLNAGTFSLNGPLSSTSGAGTLNVVAPTTVSAPISKLNVECAQPLTLTAAFEIPTFTLTGGCRLEGNPTVSSGSIGGSITTIVWEAGTIAYDGTITVGTVSQETATAIGLTTTTLVITEGGSFNTDVWQNQYNPTLVVEGGAAVTVSNGTSLIAISGGGSLLVSGSLTFTSGAVGGPANNIDAAITILPTGSLTVNYQTTLTAPLSVSGTVYISAAASLELTAATNVFNVGSVIGPGEGESSTGVLIVSCAAAQCNTEMNGPVHVGDLTVASSATLTMSFATSTVDNTFELNGGNVNLFGTLATQNFQWQTGTITGQEILGSSIVVSGLATISGAGNSLQGTELKIDGVLEWNVGLITAGSGAFLTNNGQMFINGNVSLEYSSDYHATLTNNGNITATLTGSDAMSFQTDVENYGSLEVNGGAMIVYSYTQFPGSSLVLNDSTAQYKFTSGWLFTGGSVGGSGTLVGSVGMNGQINVAAGQNIAIEGDFVLGREGVLSLGVGTEKGEVTYGSLSTTGNCILYGNLVLTLSVDVTDTVLEGILTYSSLLYEFGAVTNGPETVHVKAFDVEYNATSTSVILSNPTPLLIAMTPSALLVSPYAPLDVVLTGQAFAEQSGTTVVQVVFTIGGQAYPVSGSLVSDSTITCTAPALVGPPGTTFTVTLSLDDGATFVEGSLTSELVSMPIISSVFPTVLLLTEELTTTWVTVNVSGFGPALASSSICVTPNATTTVDPATCVALPMVSSSSSSPDMASITVPVTASASSEPFLQVLFGNQTLSGTNSGINAQLDSVAPSVSSVSPAYINTAGSLGAVTLTGDLPSVSDVSVSKSSVAVVISFSSLASPDVSVLVCLSLATTAGTNALSVTCPEPMSAAGVLELRLAVPLDPYNVTADSLTDFSDVIATIPVVGTPSVENVFPSTISYSGGEELAVVGGPFYSDVPISVTFSLDQKTKSAAGVYMSDSLCTVVVPDLSSLASSTTKATQGTLSVTVGSSIPSSQLSLSVNPVSAPGAAHGASVGAAVGAGVGVGVVVAAAICAVMYVTVFKRKKDESFSGLLNGGAPSEKTGLLKK